MPQFTLDDQPLLLDFGGQVQAFLDRYQPLEDWLAVVEHASSLSRAGNTTNDKQHIGLPSPNYPPRPALRINQLYWPTGATRWACGVFLCDDDAKQMLAGSESAVAAKTFRYDDDVQTPFEAEMYVLAAQPISCVIGKKLWMLLLVDERYWWQFRPLDALAGVDKETTWSVTGDLAIATALGVTIEQDTPPADYLVVDWEEFARPHENAAIVLDALAWSIGQRFVRWPDGTCKLMNFDASTTQLEENINDHQPWFQIAGGELPAPPVPAAVRVTFPWLIDCIPLSQRLHKVDGNAPEGARTVSGLKKTIHSTAWARGTDTTASPTNASALSTLAAQITADYYASLGKAYDYTFQGIKEWYPCGYDDHLLYSFGAEIPDELLGTLSDNDSVQVQQGFTYRLTTRIQSLPANVAVEYQLSQDSTNVILRGPQLARLNSTLSQGSSADADLLWHDGSAVADSTIDLTIWDVLANTGESIAAETRVIVVPHYDKPSSNRGARWIVGPGNCKPEE